MYDLRGMKGYAALKYEPIKNEWIMCKWWLYPLLTLHDKAIYLRSCLYRQLNFWGIMKTSEGCRMQLKDIWARGD